MKKIIITSAITLALGLSACSEQKTPEQLIASGHQYSEQGKFSNAIIDYKNAVRLAPQDASARLGLGNAYLNQGNYLSAEKELERALELGAEFPKVAPLLAQTKTRLDKFDEVEKLVKASEKFADDDYVVIITFAGISALTNGKIQKAQDYLSQAASMNAKSEYSHLASAYLLYSERKNAEGIESINTLLETNKDFSEAIRLQGYLYLALKGFEKASESFERYISYYPLDYKVQFVQANTLIKAAKFEQANKLTNSLLQIFKDSPTALEYKAQLQFQEKNYLEAREFASKSLGHNENLFKAKVIAGISSYKLEEFEQAYDYLIGLEHLLPAKHPVNVSLLSIKIKLGYTDDLATSVARLEALENNATNKELLQATSIELMNSGDFANAQALINKAAQVAPNSAQIKMQQGALLLSQGDLSGIESVEQALTLDPSLHEAEFALARQYMQGNEINKAKTIAEKWLASEEHKVSGNLLSGMISLQEEKTVEAESYFNKTLSLDNNNVSALYGLALVYGNKKQTNDAIAGFEKVLELNPNHYQAIRRYSALQASRGNTAPAISFLNALYEKSKLNGFIHKDLALGIAIDLSRAKQHAEAISLLESIKGESNLPVRYWSILANNYVLNKQYVKAASTYGEGVQFKPNSYALRLAYIGALDKIKKFSDAVVLARKANEDFPHDENIMTTLAYLEVVNKNVDAAKIQLNALKKEGYTNFLIVTTTAKISLIEKDYQQAITLYSELYEKEPNGNNVINLSRALQFSNQSKSAEKVIETYLKENKADNHVRMLLIALYNENSQKEDQSAKIINAYKVVLNSQPDNIVALNNLAWQEYLSNDLSSAQQHIEQAIAINPNALELQESYGVILVANKKYTKAIKVLTAVQNKGSEDVTAKVALVEAYIATKQREKAQILLTGLSSHNSKLNTKIAQLKQSVLID